MIPRKHLLALPLLLVLVAGCNGTAKLGEGEPRTRPSAIRPTGTALSQSPAPATNTPFASPAPLTRAARASCPVSLPNVRSSPSEHYISTISGYQNAEGTLFTVFWAGNKVIFSPHGPGRIFPDGSLGMKWPWYRTIPGEVVIGGRRLDALAPPMPEVVLRSTSYGETGFHPSGLVFPSEGCWEITAKVGGASLTFVTLVVKVSFEPASPAWLPEGLQRRDTDVTRLPKSIRIIFGSPTASEAEVSIETTQGLPEDRAVYPEAAKQEVTVDGQPAICVQGAWDEQQRWRHEADAGALEWMADGFSYRISHAGLSLRCEDLLRIARPLP